MREGATRDIAAVAVQLRRKTRVVGGDCCPLRRIVQKEQETKPIAGSSVAMS